jgi:hypothetical protein
MTEELSVEDVLESFNSIDGIEAKEMGPVTSHDIMVGVNDESQIGQFYKTVRELGVERSATTRNGTYQYEFDSWIDL